MGESVVEELPVCNTNNQHVATPSKAELICLIYVEDFLLLSNLISDLIPRVCICLTYSHPRNQIWYQTCQYLKMFNVYITQGRVGGVPCRELPVLKTGSLQYEQIPVMRAGFPCNQRRFSLWECGHREYLFSLQGLVLQCNLLLHI